VQRCAEMMCRGCAVEVQEVQVKVEVQGRCRGVAEEVQVQRCRGAEMQRCRVAEVQSCRVAEMQVKFGLQRRCRCAEEVQVCSGEQYVQRRCRFAEEVQQVK